MIVGCGVKFSCGVSFSSLTVPGVFTITSAVMTDPYTAAITYQSPIDTGGLPIVKVSATSIPPGKTAINTAGGGTISVSGLSSSTFYIFSMAATSDVGTGLSVNTPIVLPYNYGSYEYTTPGNYTWISLNEYVKSVSAVVIGAGGAGKTSAAATVASGYGGSSTFVDSTLALALGGLNGYSTGAANNPGTAQGGYGAAGAVIRSGGNGGGTSVVIGGGGGAAGYSGTGGDGGSGGAGSAAQANGGGGGGGGVLTGSVGAGGGGVGIYGISTTGAGGASSASLGSGGGGGSGGAAGTSTAVAGTPGGGGLYGGGGGGGVGGAGGSLVYINSTTVSFGGGYAITVGAPTVPSGNANSVGGGGAVRIVWPGSERQFPSKLVASCEALKLVANHAPILYPVVTYATWTVVTKFISGLGFVNSTTGVIYVEDPDMTRPGIKSYNFVGSSYGYTTSTQVTTTAGSAILYFDSIGTAATSATIYSTSILGNSLATTSTRFGAQIEILVVAGGGGATMASGVIGGGPAGAGGAGGVVWTTSPIWSTVFGWRPTFAVSVGNGGGDPYSANGPNAGGAGGDSVFGPIRAYGGGTAGYSGGRGGFGGPGGSGGGNGNRVNSATGGASTQISYPTYGMTGYGNAGGGNPCTVGTKAGGGGGAGGAGGTNNGIGGAGITVGITGANVTYAAGGNIYNNAAAPVGYGSGGSADSGGGVYGAYPGNKGVIIIAYNNAYMGPLEIVGLTYTLSTTSRPGYNVYTITSGGNGSVTFPLPL